MCVTHSLCPLPSGGSRRSRGDAKLVAAGGGRGAAARLADGRRRRGLWRRWGLWGGGRRPHLGGGRRQDQRGTGCERAGRGEEGAVLGLLGRRGPCPTCRRARRSAGVRPGRPRSHTAARAAAKPGQGDGPPHLRSSTCANGNGGAAVSTAAPLQQVRACPALPPPAFAPQFSRNASPPRERGKERSARQGLAPGQEDGHEQRRAGDHVCARAERGLPTAIGRFERLHHCARQKNSEPRQPVSHVPRKHSGGGVASAAGRGKAPREHSRR